MKGAILGICICLSLTAGAQRACGTTEYREEVLRTGPHLPLDLPMSATGGVPVEGIIRIPVVFHVVYGSGAENISEAQIRSQLEALNADFRRRRSDTASTPQPFKSLAADAGIEFVLATSDPQGRPTSGITRRATSVRDWGLDDRIKSAATGGAPGWDSRYYLNIWVGNLRSLLGYSSAPGGPSDRDGIVLDYSVVGTINTAPPFHLGRTAVHEVGHWLGLRHIWGDAYCGDDGIEDTPKQGNFTSGCPTGPRSTCSNSGDMYMNFMDFTNDACINLFTQGQKARMRAQFSAGGYRHALLTSKGASTPWAEPLPLPAPQPVAARSGFYPNPAREAAVLDLSREEKASVWRMMDGTGRTVRTWQLAPGVHRLSLAGVGAGTYYMQSGKLSYTLVVL